MASDPAPAFDRHHPPDAGLIADCVHCGFCLPSCPTYLLWGEEMDSPRGRIYLMQAGLDGAPMSASMAAHVDRCLGCLACVTACPSGVRYDALIEATRAQVERRHRRPALDRLLRAGVFALFPHPGRLAALRPGLAALRRSGLAGGRLTGRLPGPLRAMAELAPELPAGPGGDPPERTEPAGPPRARVALALGCVPRALLPGVNAATARVLAAEGCEVLAPREQGCCGALSLHSGREAEAVGYAKATIAALDATGADRVAVSAAGCGSAMKGYGRLLADEPGNWPRRAADFAARVRDSTELLAELGPRAPRRPVTGTAAYVDACHLSHGQGVRGAPRELLAGIPGLRVAEVAEPEICCGSAGVYNVLQPEAGRALGERKADHVLATGADVVVTANPGCRLQLAARLRARGNPLPVRHPVEILDASLHGGALPAG